MTSNKREKKFPYLIFIPFFGPYISMMILHASKMSKYPKLKLIFLKYMIISVLSMTVLTLLGDLIFGSLQNELLMILALVFELIIIAVVVSATYLYIYKNEIYPMIEHGQTMDNEDLLKQNDSRVYQPHFTIYLFIPVIGVIIGYINNYNHNPNKSIGKLLITFLFLIVSSVVFITISIYVPILSNSFNLNIGDDLIVIIYVIMTTIVNDIIFLLHRKITY
ncbi:hypothetical protein BK010_01640 [Tenericutes bacterium MO-XQ]|nr:hypothetical protein BK010_01640 [Tenericutes bacterium MO-XQ]